MFLRKPLNITFIPNPGTHLVCDGEILTVLSNIFPNEDIVVFKEDGLQLFYTVQALFPHIRLWEDKYIVSLATYNLIIRFRQANNQYIIWRVIIIFFIWSGLFGRLYKIKAWHTKYK